MTVYTIYVGDKQYRVSEIISPLCNKINWELDRKTGYLDCDCDSFEFILNYLRGYDMIYPSTDKLLVYTLHDAKRFELNDLVKLLETNIKKNHAKIIEKYPNLINTDELLQDVLSNFNTLFNSLSDNDKEVFGSIINENSSFECISSELRRLTNMCFVKYINVILNYYINCFEQLGYRGIRQNVLNMRDKIDTLIHEFAQGYTRDTGTISVEFKLIFTIALVLYKTISEQMSSDEHSFQVQNLEEINIPVEIRTDSVNRENELYSTLRNFYMQSRPDVNVPLPNPQYTIDVDTDNTITNRLENIENMLSGLIREQEELNESINNVLGVDDVDDDRLSSYTDIQDNNIYNLFENMVTSGQSNENQNDSIIEEENNPFNNNNIEKILESDEFKNSMKDLLGENNPFQTFFTNITNNIQLHKENDDNCDDDVD